MSPTAKDPPLHDTAIQHLRRDPVLKELIDRVGPCNLIVETDWFASLVEGIISQQISSAAANVVLKKLREGACKGSFDPAILASLSDKEYLAAGVSVYKARALADLGKQVQSGTLKLEELPPLSDEQVITRLMRVRGVGRWTAQMFLIFALGREDILPVRDQALRAAIKRWWNLPALPNPPEIDKFAEHWHPHCSVATWYLWQSSKIPVAPTR